MRRKRLIVKLAKEVLIELRKITSPFRCLPQFIVIGAQKSGTTTLHRYLAQHPEIRPPIVKEVHYFDGGLQPGIDTYKKGVNWYRAHFPLCVRNVKTFETSPLYLFNPKVPGRIRSLLPNVKLIAILRNPTERAISHYFHNRYWGIEELPIMEALLAEEHRIMPAIEREDFKDPKFIHFSYKARGRYYEQVLRYLSFFKRHQLMVISSEKFFREPNKVLRQIWGFLEVREDFVVETTKAYNVNPEKTDVPNRVRKFLNSYFAEYNASLFELIGEVYEW